MDNYFGRSGWSNIDIRSNVWPTVGLYGVPLTLHSFGTAALPLQSLTLSKNWHPCQFLDMSFLLCKKHHYCLKTRTSMSVLRLTFVLNGEHAFRLCRNIASDSLNRPPCRYWKRHYPYTELLLLFRSCMNCTTRWYSSFCMASFLINA